MKDDVSALNKAYLKVIMEQTETPFDGLYTPSEAMIAKRQEEGYVWNADKGDYEATPERQAKDEAEAKQRADMRDDAYVADLVAKFKQQVLDNIDSCLVVEPNAFTKAMFKPGNYLLVSYTGFATFRGMCPCVRYIKITPELAIVLNSGDENRIKRALWIPLINKAYGAIFRADLSLDFSDVLLDNESGRQYKLYKIKQLNPAMFAKVENPEMLELDYSHDGTGLSM